MASTTRSLLTQQICNTCTDNTSSYRRWNKEHRTPLCEFGETVLYQLPHVKNLPKVENRFLPAIWLGKDAASGETLLGIATKVVRSRTIKRQPEVQQATDGYHQQQRTEQVPNSRYNSTTTSSIQTSTTQDSAKQQVNRQQRSSNDSSLNCQLRTHQWQQHQHITTNVHHYHHRKEHYWMKLQRVRRQSKQDDKKHQQV